jgi:hypothetical protein
MPFFARDKGFAKHRADAIEVCTETLAKLETTSAPRWVITLLTVPIFIWMVLSTFLKVLVWTAANIVGALFAIAAAPFIGLYIFADLTVIMFWFMRRASRKLSGEEK